MDYLLHYILSINPPDIIPKTKDTMTFLVIKANDYCDYWWY